MITFVSLSDLDPAETIELARMLLARKLMPDDGRGTLSPMVNAPLAQSVILQPDIPTRLSDWLPRLKHRFSDEMGDTQADPSLSRHLHDMQDYHARWDLICQYFLPFHAKQNVDTTSTDTIAAAFDDQAAVPANALDLGMLYPATPENGAIKLPLPFLGLIFDQIIRGRHSHLYLETRKSGGTDAAASDAVILMMMDVMAANDASLTLAPFRSRKLSHRDFAQSFAYTQMMELGFSRDDMMEALTPWDLV